MNGQASFETARDTTRNKLHSQSPALLPYGPRGTSVSALASAILAPQNFVAISSPKCTSCEYSEASIDDRLDFVLFEKEYTVGNKTFPMFAPFAQMHLYLNK